MSLDRLALVLFCVAMILIGTFYFFHILLAFVMLHPLLGLIPIGGVLVAVIIFARLIAQRNTSEEDYYESIEK